MSGRYSGYPRQEAVSSAAPLHRNFNHLDAAATALTVALKNENIPHIFHGGYAASLIGGRRITEDVDVIVGRRCLDTLLRLPGFSKSTDNRLIFHTGRHEVLIDLMHELDSRHCLPHSESCRRLQIRSRDHPDRRIYHSIEILHPSTLLLTKLIPWHEAFYATRAHAKMRAMTDLEDIETILNWLVCRNQTIDLDDPPRSSAGRFLRILGDLFMEAKQLRPLLALALSVDDLRSALNTIGRPRV